MIVSGWVLHLYCDMPLHQPGIPSHDIGEFGGCNEREAKRYARAAGWVMRAGMAKCPGCLKQPLNGRGQQT